MICCYQVTKIVSARYGSAIASSARGPCNFRPLTDLAISVFREMSIKTAYTNPHVSWMWALKILHEKNWRESLHVLEFHHPPIFFQNSCSHSGISELARPESANNGSPSSLNNVSPRSFFGSFLLGFGVLLA